MANFSLVTLECLLLFACCLSFKHVTKKFTSTSLASQLNQPAKMEEGPVLSFVHPETACKVHLLGVSHGSEASSSLVRNFIRDNKPSAVVLELCEERFVLLCLSAGLSPVGDDNLITRYEKAKAQMKSKKVEINNPVLKFFAILRFAREHGFVGGIFVLLGLFVGALQKLMSSGNDDEFTTAIKLANDLTIPLRLGDAPQNETLKNLMNMISIDTINPAIVATGAKALVRIL